MTHIHHDNSTNLWGSPSRRGLQLEDGDLIAWRAKEGRNHDKEDGKGTLREGEVRWGPGRSTRGYAASCKVGREIEEVRCRIKEI